jgi:hypothetical protein
MQEFIDTADIGNRLRSLRHSIAEMGETLRSADMPVAMLRDSAVGRAERPTLDSWDAQMRHSAQLLEALEGICLLGLHILDDLSGDPRRD